MKLHEARNDSESGARLGVDGSRVGLRSIGRHVLGVDVLRSCAAQQRLRLAIDVSRVKVLKARSHVRLDGLDRHAFIAVALEELPSADHDAWAAAVRARLCRAREEGDHEGQKGRDHSDFDPAVSVNTTGREVKTGLREGAVWSVKLAAARSRCHRLCPSVRSRTFRF